MTKNLLHTIMIKEVETAEQSDSKELVQAIEKGYLAGREPKYNKKKTFAPSTIAYGHGECPRYWYLAFEGAVFEDNNTPYGVANMTAGTKSHDRIQDALMGSGIAEIYKDDEGNPTTEFKIINQDPPIFGYGDAMLNWKDEQIVGEIKTAMSEGFEYRKAKQKGKTGHLIQLLIYMKILKKSKGVLIYENKNNHELLIIPVTVNDYYRKWIDNTFDWLRQVRKVWEDKTLPTKNYRSNSKICKTCPIKKACGEAGVGVIKIASLEELRETM